MYRKCTERGYAGERRSTPRESLLRRLPGSAHNARGKTCARIRAHTRASVRIRVQEAQSALPRRDLRQREGNRRGDDCSCERMRGWK